MWQVFPTALCSTRRRRGRHRWDALRPDKHPAVMARRSGQGMKPLTARACARPLTAPSTMTLLEQPNRARCAINCRIHRSLMERARSRSSAGYRPATLPLDSLVGSLVACASRRFFYRICGTPVFWFGQPMMTSALLVPRSANISWRTRCTERCVTGQGKRRSTFLSLRAKP